MVSHQFQELFGELTADQVKELLEKVKDEEVDILVRLRRKLLMRMF